MKRFILLPLICLISGYFVLGQTVEFTDDFESGTSQWVLTGVWGLTDEEAHGGDSCLTDSPGGDYANNVTSYATMATGVDLSSALSAELTFWTCYQIEDAFDYMYLDISTDDFTTFTNLDVYDGHGGPTDTLPAWEQLTYSLGGFVGNANIKLRFRFETDQGYVTDGMYIDDFEITSSDVDNAPPLILHDVPLYYEGALNEFTATAELIDVSGIGSTEITYTVEGGAEQSVSGTNTTGNEYEYVIPEQTAGSTVRYWITATDVAATPNSATSDTGIYIAGNHIFYDDGYVSYLMATGAGSDNPTVTGAAMKVTLDVAPSYTDLVYMLIRNYYDVSGHDNDSMLVHVWSNNGGIPGDDLITPFKVWPESNAAATSLMTRIDLRDYSADLSLLAGEIFIGYTVPEGKVHFTYAIPGDMGVGDGDHSFLLNSDVWEVQVDYYHFRAVTTDFYVSAGELEQNNEVTVYPNPMTWFTVIDLGNEELDNVTFELYNILGEKVVADYSMYDNRIRLERNDLSAGTYIFKVYTDSEILGEGKLIVR